MAQQRAQKAVLDGYLPIIIGEKDHPEVKSLKKWAGSNSFVVEYREDIYQIPRVDKYAVIIQTTFELQKFEKILAELQHARRGEYRIEKTICDATAQRQASASELAKCMDAMIVIGGRNSSNSRKLYEICCEECENTYFIQTLVDLGAQGFTPVSSVGITAGASTPEWIITQIIDKIKEIS